jgi:hypothetical protein
MQGDSAKGEAASAVMSLGRVVGQTYRPSVMPKTAASRPMLARSVISITLCSKTILAYVRLIPDRRQSNTSGTLALGQEP